MLMAIFRNGELAVMAKILSKLRGGDRRSIGKVGEVVTAVRKKPDLFKELVAGLFDADPVVRMRAADAMEKISLKNPQFLQSFKTELIRLAQQTPQQELRWHMAQMIPRLKLTPKETATVTEIFFEYLKDKSKIVVAFAMQALSDLAIKEADASTRVIRAIEKLAQTGSPAIQSRGKKLLPKLKNISQRR
jgi:HEAT repeat protein